jgi:hypothetical protein
LGSEEKSLKTKLCLNLQKQNLIKW